MSRESRFPMVPVNESLICVLGHVNTLDVITMQLQDVLNYSLAQTIVAPEPFPPFRASVMV